MSATALMPWLSGLPKITPTRRTHDIQNQLSVIQGFAELLIADAATDDPRREDFEIIREAALTARHLLEGGLTASADPAPRPPPGS